MPCDCQGFMHEDAQPLPEYPQDVVALPVRYRELDGYGIGISWYQYTWDLELADEMVLAQYADVLDVEMIDDVTWDQAIEMIAAGKRRI